MKVDLEKLPRLNSASASGAGAAGEATIQTQGVRTAWRGGAGVPAVPPAAAGEAPATVVVTLPADAESARLAAERATQDQVSIAIAKSAAPGSATFMIHGPAALLPAARASLEASLRPRARMAVDLPQAARSALLGQRGSALRALEEQHHVRVELERVRSPWNLDRFEAVVHGASEDAKRAVNEIKALIPQRQFTATLRVWPEFPLSAELVLGTQETTLRGTFSELLPKMRRAENRIVEIERTYERTSVPTNGAEIPIDLLLAPPLRALVSGPVENNSEVLVYSPSERTAECVAKVRECAKQQSTEELQIGRAHGGNAAHARMLERLFLADRLPEKIGEKFGVRVRLNDLVFKISGPTKNVLAARKELVSKVNELSPSSTAVIRGMRYAQVRQKAMEFLKFRSSELGPVRAFIGPSDEMFLVYVDSGLDFAPSPQETQRALSAATERLSFLTDLANKLVTKNVRVPRGDGQFAATPLGDEAVQLKQQLKVDISVKEAGDEEDESDVVVISGPKEAVEAAAEQVHHLAQLSRAHALRASYTEDFQVDAPLVRQIVGRQGAQIEQFRKNHQVKIQVDRTGRVSVQGVEQDVKQCIRDVLELQRRLRDEQTEELEVPAEYHARLIGPQGKFVNRMREQHGCTIRFPDRNAENRNTIFIRGPSRGVAAVKREFLDLLEYERAQSFEDVVKLKAQVLPFVLGRGQHLLNAIRTETGVQAVVSRPSETEAEIRVTGEKNRVREASRRIRELASAETEKAEIEVPTKLRGLLRARRPILLEQAGVKEEEIADDQVSRKLLGVPRPTDPPTEPVRIRANAELREKIAGLVKDFVADINSREKFKQQIDIPADLMRFVIGAGRATLTETEKKLNVIVDAPSGANAKKPVTVVVYPTSVEDGKKAVERIRQQALPESIKIRAVAESFQDLRQRLRTKFGARCTLLTPAPQQPAQQGAATQPVYEKLAADADVEIRAATPEACREAASFVKAELPDTRAYLPIPEGKRGGIIGAGGRNIADIRKKSNCSINVPFSGPVTVVGKRADVEKAVETLLQAASSA